MVKELEQHIQQMADEKFKFLKERSLYKRGIKDADSVGFALWLDHKYYSTTQGMWADSGNGNEYTLEELYLIYLKQKEE